MTARDRLRIAFDVFVLSLFAYAAYQALGFSRLARYMPLYVSVAGIGLTSLLLVLDSVRLLRAPRPPAGEAGALEHYHEAPLPREAETAQMKRVALYLGWMLAYIGLIRVIGLPTASAVFLAAFLRFDARMTLGGIALSVTAMVGALLLMRQVMNLRWPSNLMGW